MIGYNKAIFYMVRFIIFMGVFPFAFYAYLLSWFDFKGLTTRGWIDFFGSLFIILLILLFSLFPKFMSNVFWMASEEKKCEYIFIVEIIVAILLTIPTIWFFWILFSGSLLRGLAEL